ncbi:MAG: nuclear transport factor 2 family protein [Oscillatoria sp. PMC 1068.18]|nr:nuclear transport factor 2 family protein [Oscillatoria sp. PMC 1076.18]MEC4987761.1 nuclear transport factor 2 family protein [Oscillatoria sp. PMC 1068.18]
MAKQAMEAAIAKYFENMTAMNSQGWLEIFAENALVFDPVGKMPVRVHQDSDNFFRMLSSFLDSMAIAKDNLFICGNEAAVKWTMTAIAKNGRQATAEGVSTFIFNKDGKIQKVSSYWDDAAAIAQLKG